MQQFTNGAAIFWERIKTNPVYAGAVFGLIYQVLAYFGVNLAWGDYKEWVDTLTTILIGSGVVISWKDSKTDPAAEKPPDTQEDHDTKFKTL